MQRLPAAMQVTLIVGRKDQPLDELTVLADKLHRLSPGVFSVEVTPAAAHP